MRYAVAGTQPHHHQWLLERTGGALGPGAKGIAAYDARDGRIVGMLTYDDWTHNACTMQGALDVPSAWRSLCGPAFEYPFRQAGKGVLYCRISHLNERSIALVEHLGFRKVATLRDAIAEGIDMLIYEMRREECRFLKEKK